MAPSFDYAVSSLLCAEDNASIFDDEVDNIYGGLVDDIEISSWQNRNQRNLNQDDHNFICGEQGFSGFVSIQMQSEESLSLLFDKESEHLPRADYLKRLRSGDLDLDARNEAFHWIEKVQSHYNFGPLCLYLAINYLDRFLSAYELPKGKAWMMQLLSVACVSLAAKMEETNVPYSLDLQVGETKYVFEAKTIQRMELLVLTTLKWRMQSVTPFSFIDYFLYKLNGDQTPPTILFFQSFQLILSTIKGIELLEFKASEIAAAVAISVSEEAQIVEDLATAISFLSEHVQKERVMKCVELIHDLKLNNKLKGRNGSVSAPSSVPHSPIGVLDAACLSYKTDDSSTEPSGSFANSSHNSPSPKRRKLNSTSLFIALAK